MSAHAETAAGRAAYALLGAAMVVVAVPKFTGIPVGTSRVQLSDLLVIVAAAAAGLDAMLRRRVVRPELFIGLGLYLAGALVSLTQADNLKWSALKLGGIVSLMAAMVVGVQVTSDRARWRRLADLWVAASLTVSAACVVVIAAYYAGVRAPWVLRFTGDFGSLPPGAHPRLEGTFLNSNMFSSYLGVSLCLYFARFGDWAGAPRGRVAAGALLLAAPLPYTMSPNLGAVAVSAIVLLVASRALRAWLRALVVVGAGLAATLFLVVTALVVVPHGQGDVSLGRADILLAPSGRTVGLVATLRTYAEHPLTGTGVGEPVAHFHHEHAAQGSSKHPKDFHLEAHNIYSGLLAQMGPLALLGFLWLFVRLIRDAGAVPDRWLRAGFLAALIGQIGWGGLFGGFEDARHTWLLFALVAALPGALPMTRAESPSGTKEELTA